MKETLATMRDDPSHTTIQSLFRNTSFRHLWVGQIFSQFATSITMFVLALRVYQTSSSSTAVSGLFLTFGIPAFLFAVAAGAIVDHFDKRSILVCCDIIRAILSIAFVLTSGNLYFVYLFALIAAFVTQFYTPAEAPTIPRLVPSSELVSANSLFSFTYYSSLAVGSMFAGPMLRLLGPDVIFILIAVLYSVAAVNAFQLPNEPGKRTIRSIFSTFARGHVIEPVIRSAREGIVYVRSSRVLLDALLLLTGTQIVVGMLATLAPAFADRMLEIDIHDASLVIVGPVVLGIILGSLWVGNSGYRFGTNRLIRTGVISGGFILILIAVMVRLRRWSLLSILFTNHFMVLIVLGLFFLLGLANSLLDVPANSTLQKEAQGDMRGRVYGMLTAIVGGVGIIPIMVGGVLADTIGVGKVIFLLGVVISTYGMYRIRYNQGGVHTYN